MNRSALSLRLLIAALVLWGSFSVSIGGAAADPVLPPAEVLTGEGPWVVRAYYTDREMVNQLARWLEPWEVHHDRGYLVAEVTAADYARMEALGFRIEVDVARTERLRQPNVPLKDQVSGIPGYPCYRTVEETFATASQIAADYPDIAQWVDVGDSWEKATPGGLTGYDMWVLRLTNRQIQGPKPKYFIMAAVHAREYTTAEMLTRFAEYLVQNYGVDPDVTWILDEHEVHLMLQSNPDGRKQAETGLSWRKNTNTAYCGSSSNSRGADLNRNFSFEWGCCNGSSTDPCDLTYRGPAAASEPETIVIENYVRSQFPDRRAADLTSPAPDDTQGIFLDLHSYSELVLWAWGFTYDPAPNGTALQTLGRRFAYFNGYTPQQAVGLYPTDGSTDDFAYGELGLPAYTFEMGTDFFEPCANFEKTIVLDNLPALLYGAKVLRTPYVTPGGPDALNLTLSSTGVAQGEIVQLTASIDDTRYVGGEPVQNIVAAEYYVDLPPWKAGAVAHSMTAVDGVFNQTAESVYASVDTYGLANGRHMLFVRGKDASGRWGPVSAAFLYVLDPDVSPVIEGYVRNSLNQPVESVVTAGGFRAQSDDRLGHYRMMLLNGGYDLSVDAAGYIRQTRTVTVSNGQHVYEDFFLQPLCSAFEDDVEGGNAGWSAEGSWAISTESSHSPTHGWSDSPGGNYGNSRNVSLTSPAIDLAAHTEVQLRFWHTYDFESGWDYGYVEYSTDGGSTWEAIDNFTGSSTSWGEEVYALPALDGESDVKVRFRAYSDSYLGADGWHIDDVQVAGISAACSPPPEAPAAAFFASNPHDPGVEISFLDLTQGSIPLSYAWNFGDGATSTSAHPVHAYALPGEYTVWLTATNAYGSDVFSETLTVRRSVTWNGNLSSDWHAAGNWGGSTLPASTTDVVIPAAPAGKRWPTVSSAAACHDLTLQPGAQMTVTAGVPLTVTGSVSNSGRLHQTRAVDPASGPVAFLDLRGPGGGALHAGLTISPTSPMGDVAVTVRGNQTCGTDGTLSGTVARCFTISPEISGTAVITFYYAGAEANGNFTPRVYHHEGGSAWSPVATSPVSQTTGTLRYVAATISEYSHFALSDGPQAPAALRVHAASAANLSWVGLALTLALGLILAAGVWQGRAKR